MGASVVLYRGIEKALKNLENSFEEKRNRISDLFIQSGYMLPEGLLEELYQFYLDPVVDVDSLRELAYHLIDVIDLFDMDYDDNKDPIKLEEWITIKNIVSSYASDIDDKLLTYIFQFAIEKGAFQIPWQQGIK